MNYKYSLIISQYYHSRHFFIVRVTDEFIVNAKNFARELMTYKRDENKNREMYLGDLDYFKDRKDIISRYNINDSGDIYFIQGNYSNYCMSEALRYHEDSIREGKGYKKKTIIEAISEHHDYTRVKEIVEKYFEIV